MMRAMLEKLEQPQVGKRKRKRKNHWPTRYRVYHQSYKKAGRWYDLTREEIERGRRIHTVHVWAQRIWIMLPLLCMLIGASVDHGSYQGVGAAIGLAIWYFGLGRIVAVFRNWSDRNPYDMTPPKRRTYASIEEVERAELIDEIRAAGDRAAENTGLGWW